MIEQEPSTSRTLITGKSTKEKKKNTWSRKGGFVAPLIVPLTPNGEPAARLRNIATTEAEVGVNFWIVETNWS